jgi:hypothetical protein
MKKSVAFFFFFILTFCVQAQIEFEKIYGTTNGESCNSIQAASDGGYILAGSVSVVGNQDDMYLTKIDSTGNLLWTKTYGGTSAEYGIFAIETNDGGFIIAGYTQVSAGYYDIYIVKTDSAGNLAWSKKYGGAGSEIPNRIEQTTDGGFYISGYTEFSYGPRAIYAIKTDANGNVSWTKAYRGMRYATGYCAQQTSDHGYILTGQIVDSLSTYVYDVLLVKTDSVGDTLWTRTFGGSNTEEPFSVKQTTDEGYIVTGRTYSYGAGSTDVFLTKTDSIGIPQWTKTFGGIAPELAKDVQQTQDGGYIVAAWTQSFGNGVDDYYLIKTDANGDTLWTKAYGGSGGDFAYSIKKTSDGGYIVAGESYSFPFGDYNLYVVKTDSNGNAGCFQSKAHTIQTSPVMPVTNLPCVIYSGGVATVVSPTVGNIIFIDSTFCSNVGIEENNRGTNSISIFPNPFSNSTTIHIDDANSNEWNFQVYDNLGKLVFEKMIYSQDETLSFNLTSGMYFYKVKNEKEIISSGKLVVQ